MAEVAKKEASKAGDKNTGMAIVGLIVFFVPLLTDSKNDPFVKFYVKQGLALFISWIVVGIAAGILVYVPMLGFLISQLLSLALFIILIIGIMGAAKGEQKPLPIIGQYAENFKF
jgi:uncharacterized membrane protein